MEQKHQLLRSIELFSEEQKLEYFKVEELETRLEMAVSTAGGSGTDGACANSNPDGACTNGVCW